MLEVAHHGVAATQLCGAAIPLVVVADGAIPHHCQDEGEDPLVVTGGKAEGTGHFSKSESTLV